MSDLQRWENPPAAADGYGGARQWSPGYLRASALCPYEDLLAWSDESVTVLVDTAGTFRVRDNFTTTSSAKRFLRLKLTRK